MTRFIREIPMDKIVSTDLDLENMGFIIVWREDSMEVWYSDAA